MFFSVSLYCICVRKWGIVVVFLGTFEHSIDPKNRLTLPAVWRKLLDDKVIISISSDNCIEIRTIEAYKAYTDTLLKLDTKKEMNRRIQRTIFSNSSEIQIDSANRILLPASLINLAKIKKSVVMFGVVDKIEIWNLDEYTSEKRSSDVKNLNQELEGLSSNE
mgnify:CR=1 FL=1